ncbi:MAG: hypothetical protein JKY01_10360 [Pseudomonadales bacterium]|nr:hypothetical protein [Pseudomonadales bacterium]
MKINFTKKEYRALVELLDMADWVVNAHSVEESADVVKYSEIIQKVFSHHKEMECEDLIEHSKKLNGYYLTKEGEENCRSRQYIEEFEEDSFWEVLISKLVDRDVIKKYGVESLSDLEIEERFSAIGAAEDVWATELEENGLARIEINRT